MCTYACVRARENARVLTLLVTSMMKGGMVLAFETWLDVVEDQKEQRDKMRRVMGRMMNATLAQAFELWVDQATASSSPLLSFLLPLLAA